MYKEDYTCCNSTCWYYFIHVLVCVISVHNVKYDTSDSFLFLFSFCYNDQVSQPYYDSYTPFLLSLLSRILCPNIVFSLLLSIFYRSVSLLHISAKVYSIWTIKFTSFKQWVRVFRARCLHGTQVAVNFNV